MSTSSIPPRATENSELLHQPSSERLGYCSRGLRITFVAICSLFTCRQYDSKWLQRLWKEGWTGSTIITTLHRSSHSASPATPIHVARVSSTPVKEEDEKRHKEVHAEGLPFKPNLQAALSFLELKNLLQKYESAFVIAEGFPMMNSDGEHLATDLLCSTYVSGLPMLSQSGDYDSNQALIQDMQTIVMYINQVSVDQQRALLVRLADCFMDCQALQARMIDKMAKEIRGFNSFSEKIKGRWSLFKDMMLDAYIRTNHSNCEEQNYATPEMQLQHLKSAYLIAWGNKYGLTGAAASKADRFKAYLNINSEMERAFVATVVHGLKDFIFDIAQDINHHSASAHGIHATAGSQEHDRQFNAWLQSSCLKNSRFGKYDTAKEYLGLAQATSEQVNGQAVYISQAEGMEIVSQFQDIDSLLTVCFSMYPLTQQQENK